MILAVASGKGGTGKTTLAVNLARSMERPVQLLDCDVEEPNAHLFLHGTARKREAVSIPVPEVEASLCDGCGECARVCEYHAIVSFGTEPLTFPEMCHGCGGCTLACPRGAIRETEHRIGEITTVEAGNVTLVQGTLDVGAAMAPPLIRAVKRRLRSGGIAILDAPPGTSCPVITTVRGADLILLITEPTPFGLNDLRLAVDMVKELRVPFAVVVNRVGIGDDRVHEFCREEAIPILMEIPDDRRIAEAYSRGELAIDALPELRGYFSRLFDRAMELIAPASESGRQGAVGGQ